ncbi:MAG: T9SS type A sorting domain-containing protein [Ferruginibacter sp.]
MEKKSTPTSLLRYVFLLTAFMITLSVITVSVKAQNAFCANETPLWIETFGTGTVSSSSTDVNPAALTYQPTGSLQAEGVYRIINLTAQKPEWHWSRDHTGDVYGKMLVVNGNGNSFYSHIVNSPTGFLAGDYAASLYLMNVNTLGTCGVNALLPVISFSVEYQDGNGSWVPLAGSPVTTPPVAQTATPVWNKVGGLFSLPTTGNFIVQNIRVTLQDGIVGGCGNDYALDDIKFSTCPSGGPTPVEFLGISAKQKGNRVIIDWSTASEFNNKYFDVEKSSDGGLNWNLVASARANGNSSTKKSYEAIDIRPVAGYNYYRIKQVDLDGKYKYSGTVNVKLQVDKSSAVVVSNPFFSSIPVEFLSKSNQTVKLTLFDITGKQVATNTWTLPKGNSKKSLTDIGELQRGMYILNIRDENGEVLYNGKLIKQ